MQILELAKQDSLATGDRFVPECESTNTGDWCVVDAHMENIVARGLQFGNALGYAKDLSILNEVSVLEARR